jgi:hypothetical protein
VVFIIVFNLFGAARTQELNEVELKPSILRELEERRKDVIYEEEEMKVSRARELGIEGLEERDADEIVRIKYPKVIMVKDGYEHDPLVESIKFLDIRGEIKKEISVQDYIPESKGPARVGVSKNKKYLRINAPVEVIPGKEVLKSKIVVFNIEGDSLWGFKHKLQVLFLSPNGEYIVGVPDLEWGDAPVFMYDKNGNILKKIDKDDRGFDLDFSKDGSYFAVTIKKINRDVKTERVVDKLSADLIIYDVYGNELWRKENIAKGISSACKVRISNDNVISVITGLHEYMILYFDKEGNLIKKEQGDLELYRRFRE